MKLPDTQVYCLSIIKVRPGKMTEFCNLMPQIVEIMEQHGWRLMGAFANLAGRLNVVTDLWQMPDANTLPKGIGELMTHLAWPEIGQGLADYVEDETLQLMSKAPFDTGRI